MTFEFFRHRVVRILTRPPELLYTLTRHWLLIPFVALVGAACMWVFVHSRPILYEGYAQLLVNPSVSSISIEAHPTRPMHPRDMMNFLSSQRDILTSHNVLHNVIIAFREQINEVLQTNSPIPPQTHLGDPTAYSDEPGLIESAKKRVMEFLGFKDIDLRDPTDGMSTQGAIESFRKLSDIQTQMGGNIRLYVYGISHETIRLKLNCWIDAYKTRLNEVREEHLDSLHDDRNARFVKAETEALKELEDFKAKYPTVSDSRLENIAEQIEQYRFDLRDVKDDIQTLLTTNIIIPANPTLQDLERQQIITKITELNLELEAKIANGEPPTSSSYQYTQKTLDFYQKKLAALKSPEMEASREEEKAKKMAILENQKSAVEDAIKNLSRERATLADKLKTLHEHEAKLHRARQRVEETTLDMQAAVDMLEAQKALKVKLIDGPNVDREPFNYHPLRMVALGIVLGGIFGVFFALLYEVFYGKVRFKHDLIDDFGLPVTVVLPK